MTAGRELLGRLIRDELAGVALRGVTLPEVPRETSTLHGLLNLWRGSNIARFGSKRDCADVDGLGRVGRNGQCALAYGSACRPKAIFEPVLSSSFSHVQASFALHGFSSELSRYDLFHGHLFRSSLDGTSFLGVLFHSYEYPASDACVLPGVNLGHCAAGSAVRPTLAEWRYRNALWGCWWNVAAREVEEEAMSHRSRRPSRQQRRQRRLRASGRPLHLGMASEPRQAVWLLDGSAAAVGDLRVDGSPFGELCPNAVDESALGQPIADLYDAGGVMGSGSGNGRRRSSSSGRVWCAHVRSS